MPKLSIIVTSYNAQKYLKKCLNSLLSQTLKDIEIIVVDDASLDGSVDLIRKVAKKDLRLRPVFLHKNSGVSTSRNHGLALARAPYIMFCDGDDYYAEDMCAKMYSAITKESTDLAVCKIKVHYEAHQEMEKSDTAYYDYSFYGRQVLTPKLISKIDSSVDNKIFSKKIITSHHLTFPEGVNVAEDAFFTFAYLYASKTAFFLDEALYNYVRRPQSLMSENWSKDDRSIDHVHIFIRLHEFLTKEKLFSTDAFYELFWSQFCEYVVSAHRWCKTPSTRKHIRLLVHDFLNKHTAEIKEHASPKIQKKLAHQDSRIYFSPPWRLTKRLKDAIIKT